LGKSWDHRGERKEKIGGKYLRNSKVLTGRKTWKKKIRKRGGDDLKKRHSHSESVVVPDIQKEKGEQKTLQKGERKGETGKKRNTL